MSFSRKISAINQVDKDIVSGFYRQMQTGMTYQAVEPLISLLWLLYYHDSDRFNTCGHRMELNNEQNTITIPNVVPRGARYRDAVIGHGSIDLEYNPDDVFCKLLVYSWTFKVTDTIGFHRKGCVGFGLWNPNAKYFYTRFKFDVDMIIKMELNMNRKKS